MTALVKEVGSCHRHFNRPQEAVHDVMNVERGSRLLIPRSSRCLLKTQRHTEWPCPYKSPTSGVLAIKIDHQFSPNCVATSLFSTPRKDWPSLHTLLSSAEVIAIDFTNVFHVGTSYFFFLDIYYKRLLIACCLLVKVIITCMSWFVLIFVMKFSLWKWHYSILNDCSSY